MSDYVEPIEGVFTDLAAATMAPPAWVIENLLPTGLSFLGGPAKSGKSTVTMAMALMTAGYDCKALPQDLRIIRNGGPVMMFSAEATAGELHHMSEVGLRCPVQPNESILVCDDPWAFRLDDGDAQTRLTNWLNDRLPRLCIFDPLRDFHAGEERDSGLMNRLLRPLRTWAFTHDAAIVIVHHTRKIDESKGSYEASDLRGTTALFGIADSVLMVTPTLDKKMRLKATFKRAKGWERYVSLAAYDGAQIATDILSQTDELILRALENGRGGTVEELTQSLRISRTIIMESLKRMNTLAHVAMESGRWVVRSANA